MPVILLYGIYGGVTTPTEAAAVAAFYALLLAAVFYRSLSIKSLYTILVESARSSAAVGVVIGGALILNFIVVSENIPGMMSDALTGHRHASADLPADGEPAGAVPRLRARRDDDHPGDRAAVHPSLQGELGIDLVHFGVLVVVNSMIGLITPPYGILLFVINAVTGIPLKEIIGEVWAFLGVLIAALLLLILAPDLVLWLPRVFGYQG